jgi:flagellar export protein FliJ
MNRRFRLAAVLRARKAQENAAKGAVRAARTAEQAAIERRQAREAALVAQPTLNGAPAPWFVAAMSARQAMAAEVSAMARYAEQLADVTEEKTAELTEAAVRRRSVEALEVRHEAAVTAEDQAAEQRAVDEIAGRRPPYGRNGEEAP